MKHRWTFRIHTEGTPQAASTCPTFQKRHCLHGSQFLVIRNVSFLRQTHIPAGRRRQVLLLYTKLQGGENPLQTSTTVPFCVWLSNRGPRAKTAMPHPLPLPPYQQFRSIATKAKVSPELIENTGPLSNISFTTP